MKTSRGDEVFAEIVTDTENERPVGEAQIRIYTLYSEDSYAYDIEINDIEDVAAGSLAEGSNQVSLSEDGSAYYTFKPSISARYTFAPVGGMEIYSKIDADDETMYDLKKLSVSDGEVIRPKFQLVSSHTSRRSGVTNMYKMGILSNIEMRSITGHRSEKVFETYIKVSKAEQAQQIAQKLKAAKVR